jgi:hypothetical protein
MLQSWWYGPFWQPLSLLRLVHGGFCHACVTWAQDNLPVLPSDGGPHDYFTRLMKKLQTRAGAAAAQASMLDGSAA